MIRLREARIRKGISQKELSKEIQVAQNTISNWENGVGEPSLDMLIKIADFLDCSADYLLGRVDEPTHIKKDLPDDDGKVVSVEYDVRQPPSDDAMAAAVEAAKKALAEFYSQDSE